MAQAKSEFKIDPSNRTVSNPPQSYHHSVVHFRQRYDWDCGIACVMMMLTRRQRQEFLRNFDQICAEEAFGERYRLRNALHQHSI